MTLGMVRIVQMLSNHQAQTCMKVATENRKIAIGEKVTNVHSHDTAHLHTVDGLLLC